MKSNRLPVFFLSHGGGPWPFIDGMKQMYAKTAHEFAKIPSRLPTKPKAILMITGHWEARQFTLSSSASPPMEYDYSGFPEHTYHIKYPAPGSPALANRVGQLLDGAGLKWGTDAQRGFDHGTFVPIGLMYPAADVPIVMLSMKSNYEAAEHIRLGQALEPLRDEGILILGSGLTYHNMRGFGQDASTAVATSFESYLSDAIAQKDPSTRNDMLIHWDLAPGARLAHPREDHLIPLMVVAGAAGHDTGRRVFVDHVAKVPMASYQFGSAVEPD